MPDKKPMRSSRPTAKRSVSPNQRLTQLIEDAFPCGYCGGTIELGQFARTRRLANNTIVFFHPACPRHHGAKR
jgi:hypothetical protein